MASRLDPYEEEREAEEAERRRGRLVHLDGASVTLHVNGQPVGRLGNWKLQDVFASIPVQAALGFPKDFYIPGKMTGTATLLSAGLTHDQRAYEFESDVYCDTCLPSRATSGEDLVREIRPEDEYSSYLVCVVCQKTHRYMRLDVDNCTACGQWICACGPVHDVEPE